MASGPTSNIKTNVKLADILGCIPKACCISYGRLEVGVTMFNDHDRRPVGCTQKKDSDISITH